MVIVDAHEVEGDAMNSSSIGIGVLATLLVLTLCFTLGPLEVAGGEVMSPARRIGLLYFTPKAGAEQFLEAFREALRAHGWIEGKNLIIDYRFAEGKVERLERLAAELASLKPEVMVTATTTATRAAMRITKTIPIVFVFVGDPVGSGIVASPARPGGNVTGPSTMAIDLTGKQLELLKEIAPGLSRVAVLWEPTNPGVTLVFEQMRHDMEKMGLTPQSLEVRTADDFRSAFATIERKPPDALSVLIAPLTVRNSSRIAAFTFAQQLPAIASWEGFPRAGSLMSYGPDFLDFLRRAAPYVDKILRGRKPSDLPVERPTKFELVINLKTAKQLGLTIPPSILYRADRVIK